MDLISDIALTLTYSFVYHLFRLRLAVLLASVPLYPSWPACFAAFYVCTLLLFIELCSNILRRVVLPYVSITLNYFVSLN